MPAAAVLVLVAMASSTSLLPIAARQQDAAAQVQSQTLSGQTSRPGSGRRFEEVWRFHAPEARQGVAVDATHFYTVGNTHIVKYARETGERVSEWKGEPGSPLVHLNSCIVLAADLVCAHSNYPGVPMVSSIEVWDPDTLTHRASHSFGIHEGSLTWAVRRDGDWWLHFAHYGGSGGLPGRAPEWSTLVRFDDRWVRQAGYVYPPELVAALAPYSVSGGNWGPDGLLYVTGHDEPELYALRLPTMGSVLEWVDTIPAPIHGQAWVFDPVEPDTVWGIQRSTGDVVVGRLRGQTGVRPRFDPSETCVLLTCRVASGRHDPATPRGLR
jgi:hypothetical protein